MTNATEMTAKQQNNRVSTYPVISSRPEPVKETTISDLWAVAVRRRWLIVGVMGLIITAAISLCATAARMYRGTAIIQVQKDSVDALSLDNMIGNTVAPADAQDTNITLQTEAQILQSETLAMDVIKKLHLEKTADFQGKFSLIGWAIGLFSPSQSQDPSNVALEDSPSRRGHAVRTFESNLKIKPMAGTRLITIEYLSSDPHTSAAVVNLLVEDLIDYNFETRQGATQKASGWLSNQLSDLRKEGDDLQAKVVSMQKDSGMFSDGQTDTTGRQRVYTPVLDRLQQATTQVASAQTSRIMKGAVYQVVKDGDPELISGLAGNGGLAGSSPGITGSLTLLQNLRSQEALTQAQLTQLSEKFGPQYPKLTELQASLASTQKAIRDEGARIAARAKNDYETSQQIENQERTQFETEKKQAETLNSKAVAYEIARQEATQSRSMYASLLGRLKEADLVAGLRSSNITLVDHAHVPSRPAKPNIPVYVAGGIAGGLLLGICAALFREATDNRIYNIDETMALGAESLLGFLPHHGGFTRRPRLAGSTKPSLSLQTSPDGLITTDMVAALEPRGAYTEALRSLRTSLMQKVDGGVPPKLILITSSVPGEGKTTLSMNLALVYAQSGKRVLLVDTDLRTPTVQRRLGLSQETGLSSLLLGENKGRTEVPINISFRGGMNLDVMPAGPIPAYPAELLASDEMAALLSKWRQEYDYVILDSAPMLPVTDSSLLTRFADFTLVVARHNMTSRRSLERTSEILRSLGVHRTGIVLNGIKDSSATHFSYYGYKQSAYYGGRVDA